MASHFSRLTESPVAMAHATSSTPRRTSISDPRKVDLAAHTSADVTTPRRTTRVDVCVIFTKVGQVDTVNERYQAEVTVVASWRESALDAYCLSKANVDFQNCWSPRLSIENVGGDCKEVLTRDVIFKGKNQDVAFVREKRLLTGTFLETLELNHFPFDCQDLSVLVASELSATEVELRESPTDLSRVNDSAIATSQEWLLHSHVKVAKEELTNEANLGPRVRPALRFTCRVSRRYLYFLVNVMLISIVLTSMSFFAFAVERTNTYGRLQLSFLLLLTTISFKSAASQNLPKVPYLTYLDKLLLGNISLLVVIAIWHSAISLVNQNDTNFAYKDRYVVCGLIGGYALFLLGFCLSIYLNAGGRRRKMARNDERFKKRLLKNRKFVERSNPIGGAVGGGGSK